MENAQTSERKKRRVPRRVKGRDAAEYCLYAALFALLFRAELARDVRPLAFGLLYALVFSGRNAPVLAVSYFLCGLVSASVTLQSLITDGAAAGVAMAAASLHARIGKPVTAPLAAAYALAGLGARIAFASFNGDAVRGIICAALAVAFMYACAVAARAVFARGFVYGLTSAEYACLGILIAGASAGLASLNGYGVEPAKTVACLGILICVYGHVGAGYALGFSLCVGAGAAAVTGNAAVAGGTAFTALITSVFATAPRPWGAAALVLADVIYGFYFDLYADYGAWHILSAAVPAAVFLLLRPSFLQTAGRVLAGRDKIAARYIVNADRAAAARRLGRVAEIFSEMEAVFLKTVRGVMPPEKAADALAAEIPDGFCADCLKRDECFGAARAETLRGLSRAVCAAIGKGRATLLDLPSSVLKCCPRSGGLLAAVCERGDSYRRYAGAASDADTGRAVAGRQFGGVARIMDSLARSLEAPLEFDPRLQANITEELAHAKIPCAESMVYKGADGVLNVTLIVRAEGFERRGAERAVSAACGRRMAVLDFSPLPRAGFGAARLKDAPRFDVAFGSASAPKADSEVSGDTHSFVKINDDKFMIALCDGMGSGERARAVSELAVSLTENFYRAEFDNDVILDGVNRLAALGNEENFTALDICVLDLRAGAADFIKIGSPHGALKRGNDTELLPAGALPLGVLEEMKPCVTRRELKGGDIIVLNSDGVTDVFSEREDYLNFVNNIGTLNPQTLADEIVAFCKRRDRDAPRDDMTALAARVFPLV